jgi:hypothetical protein
MLRGFLFVIITELGQNLQAWLGSTDLALGLVLLGLAYLVRGWDWAYLVAAPG